MQNSSRAGRRAQLVGMNHVALEVGNVDAALEFYGSIFSFRLRKRTPDAAFVDMGDQFLALMESASPHRDRHRHFGLVVDDRSDVRAFAEAAGATMIDSGFLDFLDPWGNFIQVVAYGDIQYSKLPEVLGAMGLAHLRKTAAAIAELREKGVVAA